MQIKGYSQNILFRPRVCAPSCENALYPLFQLCIPLTIPSHFSVKEKKILRHLTNAGKCFVSLWCFRIWQIFQLFQETRRRNHNTSNTMFSTRSNLFWKGIKVSQSIRNHEIFQLRRKQENQNEGGFTQWHNSRANMIKSMAVYDILSSDTISATQKFSVEW